MITTTFCNGDDDDPLKDLSKARYTNTRYDFRKLAPKPSPSEQPKKKQFLNNSDDQSFFKCCVCDSVRSANVILICKNVDKSSVCECSYYVCGSSCRPRNCVFCKKEMTLENILYYIDTNTETVSNYKKNLFTYFQKNPSVLAKIVRATNSCLSFFEPDYNLKTINNVEYFVGLQFKELFYMFLTHVKKRFRIMTDDERRNEEEIDTVIPNFSKINLTCVGILLKGLPGVSKTTIVHSVLNYLKIVGIVVTASEIKDKWFGESEKKLTSIFNEAIKLTKLNLQVLIFIDEIDTVFSNGEQGGESGDGLRNALLTCLNNIQTNNNILVVAATNHPHKISANVLRRFHEIDVPLPDEYTRLDFFLKFFPNLLPSTDVDILKNKMTEIDVGLEQTSNGEKNERDNLNRLKFEYVNFVNSILENYGGLKQLVDFTCGFSIADFLKFFNEFFLLNNISTAQSILNVSHFSISSLYTPEFLKRKYFSNTLKISDTVFINDAINLAKNITMRDFYRLCESIETYETIDLSVFQKLLAECTTSQCMSPQI